MATTTNGGCMSVLPLQTQGIVGNLREASTDHYSCMFSQWPFTLGPAGPVSPLEPSRPLNPYRQMDRHYQSVMREARPAVCPWGGRSLTLCPLMPGRPGVPGKPRAPWGKVEKKGTQIIITALILLPGHLEFHFLASLSAPVGQQVRAHHHDLVCQTRPERKRERAE